jgi:hypothetical protein
VISSNRYPELFSRIGARPHSGIAGSLEWSQASDILRAEKTKGMLGKDLRWHTTASGKSFNRC